MAEGILDHLPTLQALVVSNLSFFDNQCLQSTHHSANSLPRGPPRYSLKLLIASDCENTTAHSLAAILTQCPDLVYLDLSGAQAARSPSVLHQIGRLSELQVLKLARFGLKYEDLGYLKFNKNLRSLDVSDNFSYRI